MWTAGENQRPLPDHRLVPMVSLSAIVVCTPLWLAREVDRKELVDGRHHLIVGAYDFARIRAVLVSYDKGCAAKNWQEAASKLSRLGKWEFEATDHRDILVRPEPRGSRGSLCKGSTLASRLSGRFNQALQHLGDLRPPSEASTPTLGTPW
jgi:Immunity protein 8